MALAFESASSLGAPGSILRTSQLRQNLTSLVIAIGLAAVLGRLMELAFAAVAGWPPLDGSINLSMITTATVLGALLVALSVQPVIRTRVTSTRSSSLTATTPAHGVNDASAAPIRTPRPPRSRLRRPSISAVMP